MRPEGIIPAVLTPLTESEEVNEEALTELRGMKLGPPRAPLTRPPKEQVESRRVVLKKAGVL